MADRTENRARALNVDCADDPRWSVPDEATTPCAVNGCDYWPIDLRGPVVTRDGTRHWMCTEHWEAIIGIVGRQVSDDMDRRESSRG